MKSVSVTQGPITKEDQKSIMDHIDDYFKGGGKGDERAS